VVQHYQVSPGYFETLGVPLLKGRAFNAADVRGGEPVALVGETAARMLWRDRDPVGQRIRFASDAPWMTVVGVVGDVLNRRLTDAPQPILYRPLEQSSELSFGLLIRTRGDAGDLPERIAREVRGIDADLPVYAVRPMTDLIAGGVAQRQFLMRLLIVFGGVATVLSLLGIYGVMAYSVSQRTREIGIRMAIGARQSDVAGMVLRGGFTMAAAGTVAGTVAALALGGFLRSQLFGVQPADPLTIAAVAIVMMAVAAAAAYLPARRAAAVDPVIALRAE
jgi:predicted permease